MATRPGEAGETPVIAIVLMLTSTVVISAAQLLLKHGISESSVTLLGAGIALMGVAGVMMTYALKHGDLSALHALIGLGFLWTTLTSVLVLKEVLTLAQASGIAIIMVGVALIGHSGRRRRDAGHARKEASR